MKRDRGANVDNEQVDSVLGDNVDRQIVIGTLSLPTATIRINISQVELINPTLCVAPQQQRRTYGCCLKIRNWRRALGALEEAQSSPLRQIFLC